MQKHFLQFTMIVALCAASFIGNAQVGAAQPAWKLTGNSGTSATTNFLGTTDNKPIVFKTNDSEKARLTGNGRLGIGIKTPDSRLQVDKGAYVSLTSPGYLILGNSASYNLGLDVNVIQARYNGTAASLYMNYYGGYTYLGPSAAVQINTAGNLSTSYPAGINTAIASGFALNVGGNSSTSGIQVTDPVDNYVLYAAKSGINGGIYVTKSSTSTGTATIEGNASGSGIGVQGSANTYIGVSGTSSAYYGVYGYSSTSEGIYGYTGGGGSFAGVHGYCASTGYGVWGEGTSGAGVYGTSTSGYAGYFVGNVYSTGSYVGSDQKLKKNIKDVTSAMDIINQLHPKTYDFRDDGNYKLMNLPQGQHYGLIAQDVEKILPNIVKETKFETASGQPAPGVMPASKNGKENGSVSMPSSEKVKSETIDFKAVNYTELIPILVKALQEQQQEIDQLKQTVQNLTANKSVSNTNASAGYLQQNTPNPFSQNTTIRCNLPSSVQHAQLVIYSSDGKPIKTYTLNNKGMNEVNVTAGTLTAGQYVYSLIADGKSLDTKYMVLTK